MPKHHSRSYGTYTVWASGKSAALAPGAAAHQDTTMPELLSWASTHWLPHTRATKLVLQDNDMRVVRRRYATEIGRTHVCTPVTNAHLVCRLLLEKKKQATLHLLAKTNVSSRNT